MLDQIKAQSREAAALLVEAAKLQPGDILVVGCSSSEVAGEKIGSASSPQIAQAILDGILPVVREKGIFLAAQCCEHLNRTIIVEREVALRDRLPMVNVVPQPKAGGSFATAFYAACKAPAAVERIEAQAGMDIGGTLIGMHLQRVAVPVRLPVRQIGEAILLCARTRLPFVGGSRAVYDDNLK